MDELLSKIFSVLYDACITDGGDGDTLCVSSDPRKMAEKFGKWLFDNKKTGWFSTDYEDSVYFHRDQEAIHFRKDFDAAYITFAVRIYHPDSY